MQGWGQEENHIRFKWLTLPDAILFTTLTKILELQGEEV